MREKPDLGQIGSNCSALIGALTKNAAAFGLAAGRADCGAFVLSVMEDAPGSASAGAVFAALCQGGLAETQAYEAPFGGRTLPFVRSKTAFPRLAALTLQSACEFSGRMVSGPIKLRLEHTDEIADSPDPSGGSLSAIVQASETPGDRWIASLADAANCRPEELTLLVAPQESVCGAAQIAGRMNENMVFTMERSLGLNAAAVLQIEGYAPVCPPGAKTKGGKTLLPDDFLHYGAFSRLTLAEGSGIDAQTLAENLAFSSTDIFGSLFSDLLEQAGGDFFKIPNLLHINKLAVAEVFDPGCGKTFRAGTMHGEFLA